MFTIGSDPEIFLALKGVPVSAHGLIPGSKANPHPVANGAIQVDGMATEFNIDPANSKKEFLDNITQVKGEILSRVKGMEFYPSPVAHFSEQYMKEQPIEAVELGCDPDFNAYGGYMNDAPDAGANMRTAGGHVHVGIYPNGTDEQEDYQDKCRLIRLMDKHVGFYSLMWDHEDGRRSMYGKAGAFRPKIFGAEYRTMSNAWCMRNSLIEFVYDQTALAVEQWNAGEDGEMWAKQAIDNSDRSDLNKYCPKTYTLLSKILGDV